MKRLFLLIIIIGMLFGCTHNPVKWEATQYEYEFDGRANYIYTFDEDNLSKILMSYLRSVNAPMPENGEPRVELREGLIGYKYRTKGDATITIRKEIEL